MTNEEFNHWIAGFIALSDDADIIDAKQCWIIQNHANLVQAVTNALHPSVTVLIKQLEECIAQHTTVTVAEFKKIVSHCINE